MNKTYEIDNPIKFIWIIIYCELSTFFISTEACKFWLPMFLMLFSKSFAHYFKLVPGGYNVCYTYNKNTMSEYFLSISNCQIYLTTYNKYVLPSLFYSASPQGKNVTHIHLKRKLITYLESFCNLWRHLCTGKSKKIRVT